MILTGHSILWLFISEEQLTAELTVLQTLFHPWVILLWTPRNRSATMTGRVTFVPYIHLCSWTLSPTKMANCVTSLKFNRTLRSSLRNVIFPCSFYRSSIKSAWLRFTDLKQESQMYTHCENSSLQEKAWRKYNDSELLGVLWPVALLAVL